MDWTSVLFYVKEIGTAVLLVAAVIVLVRLYLLIRRLHRLAARIGQLVEVEAKRTLAQVEEAARGVSATAKHVDAAVAPLSSVVHRIERWTAAIGAEMLVARAVSPVVTRVGGWLSGLRRGIGEAMKHRGDRSGAGDGEG